MGYSRGRKWTTGDIQEGIYSVMKALNIDRMPSEKEVVQVCGDYGLAIKIQRTCGGYYGWAKKLGLEIKQSNTKTGKDGEKFVAELLRNKEFKVERMSQNYPYDLFLDECCKVDVKFSQLYHGNEGNFYAFALNKKFPTCDFYVLVAENDEKRKTMYIIPAKDALQKQISIGEFTSIYTPYIDRFDLLKEYITATKRIKVNR